MADSLRLVASTPAILAQMLGFGGLVFAIVGFYTWGPTLIFERFGTTLTAASFAAVFYHHLAAYVGVLAASTVTDRLAPRLPRIRLLSMAVGLLLCAPAMYFAATANAMWQVVAGFTVFGLFRGAYDANLITALYDYVEDRLRATVTGLVLAVGFLIGSLSPLVMGALKAQYGLELGLQVIAAVAIATGAVLFATVLATRHPRQSA